MWSSHLNSCSFFCSLDRGVDGETNDEEEQAVEHAENGSAALLRDRQVRRAWKCWSIVKQLILRADGTLKT